ncbi:jg4501 [Pararge aegeria aegeria]|uniref:Jg4501 protein n=1 Tax=Pararge aegeria aegeria TaxID=348720 RepID=A0A8S4R1U3_9NEOP|nr:jg4501 [Pararge aegeria aegeria]
MESRRLYSVDDINFLRSGLTLAPYPRSCIFNWILTTIMFRILCPEDDVEIHGGLYNGHRTTTDLLCQGFGDNF